jgi:hypothetical protein
VDPLWEEQLPYQPYHYARNAPLVYKDPTGEIPIDTFWDAANVVVDVVRLVYHTVKGNKEKAKEAVVDLGYDGLALAVPYLPSGLSKVRHVDDVVDAAKGAGKAADGKKVPDAGKGTVVSGVQVNGPSAESAPKGSPKPSPKFQEPTNGPQIPPTSIPKGWRVRQMAPTSQYPNGYWRLEKPMVNGGWQAINPATMKPGNRSETHVPLPAKKE